MTTPQDKTKLIFERWKASLRDKNRSTDNVVSNFDELFETLLNAGILFDEAYVILPLAIKAHQPTSSLIRSYWKLTKSRNKNLNSSEKEFGEKWCDDIADMGTNSFYNFFPMEDLQSVHNGSDKISDKEYRLMRRHADKFKSVDFTSLQDSSEERLTDEEEIMKFIKERLR